MKAVVCIKQTPSTTAVFRVVDGAVSWEDPGGKPNVLNPWDEYAVEEAIRAMEGGNASDVVAVSMGDESTTEQLKTCLAMGCTEAVLLSDPSFVGSDSLGTARVLASAIQQMEDVGIVFMGKQAIDGDTGQTPVQVAVKLGWTPLTFVAKVKELTADSITVERLVEEGRETVTAPLPVVVTLVKEINEPRYPSFMGIRKANRATIPVKSAADLGLETGVGAAASLADWSKVSPPPERQTAVTIIEADSAEEQARLLADKLFEEKVI